MRDYNEPLLWAGTLFYEKKSHFFQKSLDVSVNWWYILAAPTRVTKIKSRDGAAR